jgi:hypothetical protein
VKRQIHVFWGDAWRCSNSRLDLCVDLIKMTKSKLKEKLYEITRASAYILLQYRSRLVPHLRERKMRQGARLVLHTTDLSIDEIGSAIMT